MIKIQLFLIPLIVLTFCVNSLKAQQLSPNNLLKINKYQDTLVALSDSAVAAKSDMEKLAFNATFVKKLIASLKTPFSIQHNLEAVNNISILNNENQTFRIISWSLALTDGTYKYYGTIQMATKDGSLKLFPLNDASQTLLNDNQITTNKQWYGARYYDIIPVTFPGKTPYYILLGWKGNTAKTTKKVIEILSFDNGEPIFGKNIFEMPKNIAPRNRIVFEYNKQNTMTLIHNKSLNMIVFDHLAPYEPNMVGNFEYYGSDLSFDGYAINYQKLYLKENIALKNEASNNDDFYATPRKATTLFQKGKH